MNKNTKDCFSKHMMIHSLTGAGVGIIVANIITPLNSIMVGLILLVVGIILDMVRK